MSVDFNIQPEQYFRLQNGRVLKNLYELINSLESMDESCFSHHVNPEKNDFSNWIRHVFKDEKLADTVIFISDREHMAKAIEKHLFEESQKSFRQIGEVKRTIEQKNEIVREKQKESIAKQKPFKKEKEIERPKFFQAKKEQQKPKDQKNGEVYAHIKESPKQVPQIIPPLEESFKKPVEDFSQKLNEVLSKEREIELREKKIEQIEAHMESELEKLNEKKSSGPEHRAKFFTKDFSQGLSIGFLVALVACLVYFKFFM
ncbi:MAG TPA: DUF5752 family protein [Candidatus Nanoarchaeia archaeon]|nr:DUF5752 family protein [Candidatus Nanoarchaeia archaeon]